MLLRTGSLVLLIATGMPVLAQHTQATPASTLTGSTSRYLSDAAASPVAWQAWSRAALDSAKRSERPIFLSVGFAASYECFRMHREAFTNSEAAETLNGYFVPILVDRIEHPEVAETFERVLQSMNGVSGWPANLILTPALEPFAGSGAIGPQELKTLLATSASRWMNEREKVIAEGRANIQKARLGGEKHTPSGIDPASLTAVVDDIKKTWTASTAPQPMTISFLLRYADQTKNEAIRATAVETLQKLALTPIHDQLGGGFHRASTDAAWREPQFEKMLTDQALLAIAYLEAFQITRDPELERVIRSTLDYAVRDLREDKGGFHASQDAHSLIPRQGPEFANPDFYAWDRPEIIRLLGTDTAAKIFRIYGMSVDENNVPRLEDPVYLRQSREELSPALAKLLDVRQKRPQPFREFTEVAGWNGLMISALARAGAVLGEQKYVDAAAGAAKAVTTKLWKANTKTLYRSDAATKPVVGALAEDYAMLIQGSLDLFDASYGLQWLDLAIALQKRQDELFWNASAGRYTTGATVPESLRGILVESDEGTPAVNSVAVMNLMRLAALTGHDAWRSRPAMIFQSFGGRLRTSGGQLPQLASALASSYVASEIVVVTGDPRKKATHDLLRSIHERWHPMRAVVFVPAKPPARDRVTRALPFTAALAPDPEKPIAYVCANGECRRQ